MTGSRSGSNLRTLQHGFPQSEVAELGQPQLHGGTCRELAQVDLMAMPASRRQAVHQDPLIRTSKGGIIALARGEGELARSLLTVHISGVENSLREALLHGSPVAATEH